VHLIPSDAANDVVEIDGVEVNVNVFRNLESQVSEGGENFSTGLALCQRDHNTLLMNLEFSSEKQLLCMARAILKRSKVLVMDEVRYLVLDLRFISQGYVAGNSKVMLTT
jgi:ABC-type ATPase involved in cell division